MTANPGEREVFFDRQAEIWSATHYGPRGGMVSRIDRFSAALRELVPEGGDVLDYGCGTGEIGAAIAALGYRVEACDSAPRMIEQAEALHASSGVTFTLIDVTAGAEVSMPQGRRYDAIICSSVLEYLHDPAAALAALSRALKPGGWLLATVPDAEHPARRGEAWHRALMSVPFLRKLIRATPVGPSYELQWLSRNRFPAADWEALLSVAQFSPVWRDCADHPLMLLAARRHLDRSPL